jgi:hypothetical protein
MRRNADHQPDDLDDLLDRVLASYTPDVPRVALENRVLAWLATPAEDSRRNPRVFRLRVWGGAGALASIVILSAVLFRFHARPAPQNFAGAQREPPVAALPIPVRPPGAKSTPQSYRRAQQTQQIADIDSVALREMHAPSHPAPEAPLTAEEKLLLRVVHNERPQRLLASNPEIRASEDAPLTTEEKLLLRVANQAGPQEVAMLNPEIRAQKEAKQDAVFAEFAGPSVGEDGQ